MGGPCYCDGKAYDEMDNFLVAEMKIGGVDTTRPQFVCKLILPPFLKKGKTWYSCEQYFQARKFTDEKYVEEIRSEKSGVKCWELGQSRKYKIVSNWEEIKVDVMYEANIAKFKQNEKLREVLLSTKGAIKAVGFPFWIQWNSRILERIREELRDEKDRDQKKLEHLLSKFEEHRSKHKKKHEDN